MKLIKEAKKEIQADTENKLKKKLLALLRDDGRGHHHAKYAKRLEDFLIKIVPRAVDPKFIAAVSWEEMTIFISDGFVTNDPDIFYQLSVLMRHELAHYLLQHDIRMAKYLSDKYGDETYLRWSTSKLLHKTLNIVMDLEISNKVYKQDDDKEVVRNLTDGIRFLPGLVTDDIAAGWTSMNLIEMYDAVEKEMEGIKNSILAAWNALDLNKLINPFDKSAYIKNHIVHELHVYTDINRPTNFYGPLDKFIKTDNVPYHFALYDDDKSICIAKYSSLDEAWQELIVAIAEEFIPENGYTRQDVRDIVAEIAKTKPIDTYTIKSKAGYDVIKLYTPEDKFIAVDALKAMLSGLDEYDTWYAKIQKVLSDPKYSDADRQKILDAINK